VPEQVRIIIIYRKWPKPVSLLFFSIEIIFLTDSAATFCASFYFFLGAFYNKRDPT
jgi:hypothetical protein